MDIPPQLASYWFYIGPRFEYTLSLRSAANNRLDVSERSDYRAWGDYFASRISCVKSRLRRLSTKKGRSIPLRE